MIAISGKERSGTTWLEYLIRRNYVNGGIDARLKHLFTGNVREAEVLTLVISKHPLAWFYSYYKYCTTGAFSCFPPVCLRKWSDFYAEWIEHSKNANVMFIRYEDLYADPKSVLDNTGMIQYSNDFDEVENEVCCDGTVASRIFKPDNVRREYENQLIDLDYIREFISEEVSRKLGYHSITLEDI